jgi:P4 family phage/plasmid primase-like protien
MSCPSDLNNSSSLFYKSILKFANNVDYNVIDQLHGAKYLITDDNYTEFFTLLNNHKSNTQFCTHLSEVQMRATSCLDIDFDIKQTSSICSLSDSDYKYLINEVIGVLDENFVIENFFIAILKKERLESKGDYFKDGIHMRVLAKFSPEERYFILKTLIGLNLFQKFAIKTSIINTDVIDLQSLSSPVLLYESNKRTMHKRNYRLHMLYKIGEDVVPIKDFSIYKNLHLELSILYEGTIPKPRAKCLRPIDVVLPTVSTQDESDMSIDLYYIKRLLEIMHEKRYTQYCYWHRIIFALAKLDIDILVANQFSRKWPNYDNCAQRKISEIYANAKRDKKKYVNHMRSIEYYAALDNIEMFNEAQYSRYVNKMYEVVIETNGNIKPIHIANEIKEKYKSSWLYANSVWYEYNIENAHWEDNCVKDYPVEMYVEITEHIPQLLKATKTVIETTVNQLVQENMAEIDPTDASKYKRILLNLSRSIDNCVEMSTIKQTIEHLQKKFAIPKRHKFDDIENRYMIGVNNGIYDLENNILIEYGPEYYITRSTRANYDTSYAIQDINNVTNKYTKRLLQAIQDIIVDPDAREYIMCYLASSLDAKKKSPIFLILFGGGKNGKSTLDELMLYTFGACVQKGYAYKIPSHFFTSTKDTSGPNSTKMGIKYSRYTTTSELEQGNKLAMAKIKEMTSDTISGNEKYQVQDNFRPICNFMLATNMKPNIITTDYGTWRRLRVYECKTRFMSNPIHANEKKCDNLIDDATSMQEYADAWLAVLIYYYNRYKNLYNRNITNIHSPTIDRETEIYKQENDHLSTFIAKNMERIENGDEFISTETLYGAYEAWYRKNVSSNFNLSIYNLENELYKMEIEDCIVKEQKMTYIINHRLVTTEDKIQNMIANHR